MGLAASPENSRAAEVFDSYDLFLAENMAYPLGLMREQIRPPGIIVNDPNVVQLPVLPSLERRVSRYVVHRTFLYLQCDIGPENTFLDRRPGECERLYRSLHIHYRISPPLPAFGFTVI